ncbi:MAG TPA: DUF3524 domain-containing protein [Tepidisphaeraceae bacterium]|jgi:hypothetical protein|nr:DUF3524 domain-containing protein [Tepidisphaeraceae bacterium]
MSQQLDILALEPFYGGVRRVMLDAVIHCSRHRWTLLKLPPRRIERRLSVAAYWFSEQLTRHWAGRTDLLFTSEALNLADLYRFVPALLNKPAVVYFHNNQLPDVNAVAETPLDLINLNTAAAATEIWFNSLFHLRSFMARATALVRRHPELNARNPLPPIMGKSQVMLPPLGTQLVHQTAHNEQIKRQRRTIFVETRDANIDLLNKALATVRRRGENFQLITVGPVEDLHADLPRTTLAESDHVAHVRGMLESNIFLSAKTSAMADHYAVRALLAGCWPLVPHSGVYRELIPEKLHPACLYDGTPEMLASRLQDTWHLERAEGYEDDLVKILRKFDPINACRAIDDRLDELVVSQKLAQEMAKEMDEKKT